MSETSNCELNEQMTSCYEYVDQNGNQIDNIDIIANQIKQVELAFTAGWMERITKGIIYGVNSKFEWQSQDENELWQQVADSLVIKEDRVIESEWGGFYHQDRSEVLTESEKNAIVQGIRQQQYDSVRVWTDFLQVQKYPDWFKLYVLDGISEMGELKDDSNDKILFKKRTITDTAPYPLLDKKILDEVYQKVFSYIDNQDNYAYSDSINWGGFNEIYSEALSEVYAVVSFGPETKEIDGRMLQGSSDRKALIARDELYSQVQSLIDQGAKADDLIANLPSKVIINKFKELIDQGVNFKLYYLVY